MSQDRPSPSNDELIVPVNVQLSEPPWTVVAHTPRVNRSWEALMQRALENTRRCYEYLSTKPMQRSPGRVFPLRGKRYKGAWEYELTTPRSKETGIPLSLAKLAAKNRSSKQ